MARTDIRRPPVEPCDFGDKLGRHRWRVRLTHHSTPDQPVWDDWCIRCGQWLTDVVKR